MRRRKAPPDSDHDPKRRAASRGRRRGRRPRIRPAGAASSYDTAAPRGSDPRRPGRSLDATLHGRDQLSQGGGPQRADDGAHPSRRSERAMSRVDPLAASPYFDGVAPAVFRALRRAGRVLRFETGQVVLRPGELNHSLFFVLAGTLTVRLEGAFGAVSHVGPGECLGEMSVIDGQPASAWVVAEEPCETLCVPEERLWSDFLSRPEFARGLLRLLSGRLRHVLERQTAFELMRKELKLAREIQSSMLRPGGALFPDRSDLDCAAAMDPAAEVGGDFYDAFFLDERHLFFAVGDVSGKGIGAALFMARALTLLRAEALRRRPLHEVLGRVNEALAAGNEQATFVALSCGVLNTRSGACRYANGGGGAPLVRCRGRWTALPMPRGLVVGAMPGFSFASARMRFRSEERRVGNGSG